MAKTKAWTDAENAALCALYFAMLDAAINGRPYNKRAMIRAAQGADNGHDCSAHQVTCGNCEQSWCERCDPAPSALCPSCHGAGFRYPLAGRSKGSIEAKLMNASAAHRDLCPYAVTMERHGYRALSNYQASLRDAMRAALADGDPMTLAMVGFEATA